MATKEKTTEQPIVEETSRGKDKWGIEQYINGSLILSIATVAAAMILYVTTVAKESAWGVLMVTAAVMTVASFFYGERSRAARICCRAVTWTLSAVALIATIICTVMTLTMAEVPMPSVMMFAMMLSPLWLYTLPVLAAAVRARKAPDIWVFRIVSSLYALVLVMGCVWGDFVVWTFSSVYVQAFVCLLAILTANFAWLIRTKEKAEPKK